MKNFISIFLNIVLVTAVLSTYTSAMQIEFKLQDNWASALPQLNAALFFAMMLIVAFVLKRIFWGSKEETVRQ